ncbi:hypothetical protein FGG08_007025 [Glutinoglossum americanum]|uniref:Dipeptidyl-peptidase V n=1 Tax=Glutinoglossum americanum TaxID=1670608 RepID=A0A9P8HRJ7_9PEZI|nr:hypothetical protein FGG08_007025 [Glutinoglossum americanum]
MCGDTLCQLQLGTDITSYVAGVKNAPLLSNGRGDWLAYQLNQTAPPLVLQNLTSGRQQRFNGVTSYSFDPNGRVLLLQTSNGLQWIDLSDGSQREVWSTATGGKPEFTIEKYVFNAQGTRLLFMLRDATGTDRSIWYYQPGMPKASLRITNQSAGLLPRTRISNNALQFSNDDGYIFFKVEELADTTLPDPDAAGVDVWSYRDSVLQETQLSELKKPVLHSMVTDTGGSRIVRLYLGAERASYALGIVKDRFTIVSELALTDKFWLQTPLYCWRLSLKDGTRQLLGKGQYYPFSYSPKGNYLVYYDQKQAQYFSYDIVAGKARGISKNIPTLLSNEYNDRPILPMAVGIAGWLEGDSTILIYDNYDIWKVDVRGLNSPVNITGGYGFQHHIKFRLLEDPLPGNNINNTSSLVLVAFNTRNKHNGFYRVELSNPKALPKLLTMEAGMYWHTASQVPHDLLYEMKPVKARDTDIWLLQYQSTTEARNYVITRNFKDFSKLTDFQPQKDWNWLTAELVSWKQLDGRTSQGVLYKPEDFDPKKKYPLILFYYEKLSQELYQFPRPMYCEGDLNIPWFVSHGYLVFTPDIYYTIGNPGASAYNSVVSAATYLSKRPYVDAHKMGIQGHSFGGFETNYLVTHTHLFAAAATASGFSDLISDYGGVLGEKFHMNYYETGQIRVGTSLWDNPDLYIANSPVFKLKTVTTPLLIMHNKADGINWGQQAIELFTGLRRLNKKVWMLQYDKGNHLLGQKEARDYTIRMTQFFDYYLKNKAVPNWMAEPIPAKKKGINSGLALEKESRIP